jgi:hypothetical protein
LGQIGIGEEENNVELVVEHNILLDWTDPGYSRKDKIDRLWDISKEMNDSGNIIYC